MPDSRFRAGTRDDAWRDLLLRYGQQRNHLILNRLPADGRKAVWRYVQEQHPDMVKFFVDLLPAMREHFGKDCIRVRLRAD